MPLSFHEGGRVDLPQPGDQFDTHMLYHTCTHSMAMMLAAVDMVGGGVCARFPGLTVAFLEGNCSWAPWLLWRLDEHWDMSGAYDHPDLTLAPSAYFRRQCYLAVECDEEPAEVVTRYGLEERIVFSTDYPHADSKYPKAVDRFLRLPLSEETKRLRDSEQVSLTDHAYTEALRLLGRSSSPRRLRSARPPPLWGRWQASGPCRLAVGQRAVRHDRYHPRGWRPRAGGVRRCARRVLLPRG